MAHFSILVTVDFEVDDPNFSLSFAKGIVHKMQQAVGDKAVLELDPSTLEQKYLYGSSENMD